MSDTLRCVRVYDILRTIPRTVLHCIIAGTILCTPGACMLLLLLLYNIANGFPLLLHRYPCCRARTGESYILPAAHLLRRAPRGLVGDYFCAWERTLLAGTMPHRTRSSAAAGFPSVCVFRHGNLGWPRVSRIISIV